MNRLGPTRTNSKDIPVSGEIHRATFAASVIPVFVYPSDSLSYIYSRSRIEVGCFVVSIYILPGGQFNASRRSFSLRVP